MKLTIGLDPGITGAIAYVCDGTAGRHIYLHDMPTVPKTSGKGHQIDAHALAHIVKRYGMPDMACIEAVNAMPGQGVTSVFSFGKSAGIIEGVLGTLGIPYTFTSPQRWKKHFGLTGKDKDAARALCIREHPELQEQLARKKDCGRADALLIALYGLKQHG